MPPTEVKSDDTKLTAFMRNWGKHLVISMYTSKLIMKFQCESRLRRHFQSRNMSVHEINSYNRVTIVNFATSKKSSCQEYIPTLQHL